MILKLLILVLWANTAFGQGSSPETLLREAQHPTGNYAAFFKTLEQRALLAGQAAAERKGSTLTIRLRSGSVRVFSDAGGCASPEFERCSYQLVAYLRSKGWFVIHEQHDEGDRFLLISDRDAHQTIFDAVPNFSQSGSRAVLCVSDPFAASLEVQVWKRDGTGFVKEWAATPWEGEFTEYKFVRWKNETSADIEAITTDPPMPPVRHPFAIKLRNGRWIVTR